MGVNWPYIEDEYNGLIYVPKSSCATAEEAVAFARAECDVEAESAAEMTLTPIAGHPENPEEWWAENPESHEGAKVVGEPVPCWRVE